MLAAEQPRDERGRFALAPGATPKRRRWKPSKRSQQRRAYAREFEQKHRRKPTPFEATLLDAATEVTLVLDRENDDPLTPTAKWSFIRELRSLRQELGLAEGNGGSAPRTIDDFVRERIRRA